MSDHDWHVTLWKRQLALQYLGERHVLHIKHIGGVSHNPAEVNVAKTVKRFHKRMAGQRESDAKRAPDNRAPVVATIGKKEKGNVR